MSKQKLRKLQDEIDALDARLSDLKEQRAALQKPAGDFVSKQDRARMDGLELWKATILLTWQRCCEHDQIDPANRLAVFSPGNPIVPYYRLAIGQFREFLSGNIGYVGLPALTTFPTKQQRDNNQTVRTDDGNEDRN